MAKFSGPDFKAPHGRLAFSQSLFKPRAIVDGGPLKYGCTLIFTDEHRKFFERMVLDAAKEAYGANGPTRLKAGGIKSPILDGDGQQARSKQTGELYGGFGPGTFFIRTQANADRPPVLRYRERDVPATQAELYSGCKVSAVLNLFSWDHPTGGSGFSFGLRMLQRIGGGDSLGGAGPVDVNRWIEEPDEDDDFGAGGNGAGGSGDDDNGSLWR